MNSTVATEFPAAVKTSPQPIVVANLSVQVKFSEFPAVPLGSGATYAFYLLDSTSANAIVIFFDDFGNVLVNVGAVAGAPQFVGAWTPNNGEHTVHMMVVAGVPTLYVDGVLIALTPAGSPIILIGTLAANTVSAFFFANVAGSHSGEVSEIFVTNEILPPTTDFCCPV